MKRTGHEIAHASKKTQRGKENSKETSACLSKETKNAFLAFFISHFSTTGMRYLQMTEGTTSFFFLEFLQPSR